MATSVNLPDVTTVTASLGAATRTASATGSSKDIGAEGHGTRVMVLASVGSLSDGTYTFSVEDSADDSTFAAVPASNLLGDGFSTISAANTDQVVAVVPQAGRPYMRVVCTVGGSPVTGAITSGYIVTLPASI